MDKAIIIGRNIARIRKEKNLTKKDMERMTGWTWMQISRYERGEIKRINYEFLLAIAKALDVTIKELEENENVET